VVEVNGATMSARDGAPIRDEAEIVLTAKEDARLVLVEAAAG
jgi:quercetin 2,3-dioxygenase